MDKNTVLSTCGINFDKNLISAGIEPTHLEHESSRQPLSLLICIA